MELECRRGYWWSGGMYLRVRIAEAGAESCGVGAVEWNTEGVRISEIGVRKLEIGMSSNILFNSKITFITIMLHSFSVFGLIIDKIFLK